MVFLEDSEADKIWDKRKRGWGKETDRFEDCHTKCYKYPSFSVFFLSGCGIHSKIV